MSRRNRANPRTQLSGSQGDKLFNAVWEALDPNGVPIRLAEIVEAARPHDPELGKAWDFYLLVSDELQRMKKAGCVYLQKGRGGGWVRGDKPDATPP